MESKNFKIIDLENWPRKQIHDYFSCFQNPIFSVTSRVDVTILRQLCKMYGISSFPVLLYMIGLTANSIPEFKQRKLQDGKIVEFNEVGIAGTVPKEKEYNIFNFFGVDWNDDPNSFLKDVQDRIQDAKKTNLQISNNIERVDLILTSCLPWIDFTSILTNPIKDYKSDAYVRIVWGRYCQEEQKTTIAVSVEVNHAFIDGYHIGLFFERLQKHLDSAFEKMINVSKVPHFHLK